MNKSKNSLILSFLVGGLIGGGITFLLTSGLMRKRSFMPARETGAWQLSDEIQERSRENGDYCAPEGADMHYDIGDGLYYSNDE